MSEPTVTEQMLRNAVAQQDSLTRRAIEQCDRAANQMFRTIAEQAAQNLDADDRERYLRGLGLDESGTEAASEKVDSVSGS